MTGRLLSSNLSVSPQVQPEDLQAIAEAGFRTVICNRPDGESADQPDTDTLAEQARALGLAWHHQPVVGGAISDEDIDIFGTLLAEADKPVFAFCRTGTRCTVLWALSQAGEQAPETLVSRAAEAGYDINGLLPRLMSRQQDQHG